MLTEQPRKIPDHYSDIMRDELQSRVLKNENYSLRAFARDLDLTSGNLSDIIKRKVGLSYEKASKISSKLNLTNEDQLLFLKLVEATTAPSGIERAAALSEVLNYDSSYVTLNDDYYRVLTEWYYFALVELVRVIDFKNDDEWIANRLGIPKKLVRKVIERLIRVELLIEEDSQLIQTYDYFISPGGTPSDVARKFHKQILSKAIEAVDMQPIEERDFTSGFLRVRTGDLPHIAKRIKEFRRELAKEIENGDQHDSVYAFSVQFFRGDYSEKGPESFKSPNL